MSVPRRIDHLIHRGVNRGALPVADGSFDRAVLSLVLHQLGNPQLAAAEAFRSLVAGGMRLSGRSPRKMLLRACRIDFPFNVGVDTHRMPPLGEVKGWLKDAGFVVTLRRLVLRSGKLGLANEERTLRVEFQGRYSFFPAQEREEELQAMRAEAEAKAGSWIDPHSNRLSRCSTFTTQNCVARSSRFRALQS